MPIRPEYRQRSISSGYPQKGYREMQALLALPEIPTAVFAVSDRSALGALEAIKDANLRVPEDIAIIGFDDYEAAEFSTPALTTVHYNREIMGVIAFEALTAQIAGKSVQSVRHVVPSELIVRASTVSQSH